MRIPFLVFVMLWSAGTFAQKDSPAFYKLGRSGEDTWAVVVGISDYLEKNISLKYAHRDAESFADWLRSPAGANLDSDHVRVLLNNQATAGRVAEALDALLDRVKENDRVFIYFSGHGDVERNTVSQPGFLLCWDAPARVYMGGGTFSLSYLQEIIKTLTVLKKAKVIVIADACRSGKLAGSEVGGPKLTARNLMESYEKETMILSCQPDEVSIEGRQWGGGRGVFSYHLIEGLYGMADQDGDGAVSLKELERYLEDRVSEDVAPNRQNPILRTSDKTAKIALVNEAVLEELRAGKSMKKLSLETVMTRGREEEMLTQLDSDLVQMYDGFMSAIERKQFFPDPQGGTRLTPSADELFARLLQAPEMAALKPTMTHHYAAALQDETQLVINKWLNTTEQICFDVDNEVYPAHNTVTLNTRLYPLYLQRASELLGEKHYFYASLKARQYFFEGFLLARSNRNANKELGEKALALFRRALDWQDESPHVLWQMSLVFGWNLNQPDSLEHYVQLANKIHPNWDLPNIDAAFILSFKYGRHDRAKHFLKEAERIDSSSAALWSTKAVIHFGEEEFDQAEDCLKKALARDSLDASIWNNLGYLLNKTGRHAEAKPIFEKALEIDSSQVNVWLNLGISYSLGGRYQEAIRANSMAIQLDSMHSLAWSNLGLLHHRLASFNEAEAAFKKAISLDAGKSNLWQDLGRLYNDLHRYDEAVFALQKSIDLDPGHIATWDHLGYALIQIQQYENAEKVLSQAVQRNPNMASLWSNLGYVYLQKGSFEQAEVALEKAVLLDTMKADIWINLGWVYSESQRFDRAKGALRNALALDSSRPLAWYSLAYLLLRESKYPEAEYALRNTLTLDPMFARAWASLGALNYELGRFDKAEPMFIIANMIDSTSFECHRQLGMVYFKKGMPVDAHYHLKKALQLNPSYVRGLISMACLLTWSGQLDDALAFVEHAIDQGASFAALHVEGDLAPLMNLPDWHLLMQRHFPEQFR
jgi:tetratricopeptide (TPR) repeat protein/uncharacterized caspase-like protein